MPERNADGTRWCAQTDVAFVDMLGPGAVTPFARAVNLRRAMEPTAGAFAEDWNRVLQTAMLGWPGATHSLPQWREAAIASAFSDRSRARRGRKEPFYLSG